jgi:hypothetical protein
MGASPKGNQMKVKVSEAKGITLDWLVAKCEGKVEQGVYGTPQLWNTGLHLHYCDAFLGSSYNPSEGWAQGGPIIEREGISVLRCEDEYRVDKKGFTTSERIPVWGAVTGQNGFDTVYGSQGDNWGEAIILDPEYLAYGPSPLIAAMRCYVASKLGAEVEVPDELV